jgi:hypothetical protein
MTNILTAAEAANYLRTETTDATMLMLLPAVDGFIQRATGRDWTADTTINPVAKAAAGMLLVQWHENPAQMGSEDALSFGLTNVLAQLEAEALKYRKYQFYGLGGAGSISIPGAHIGDDVISLVGVYLSTGNQASKFESKISYEDCLVQIVSDDLAYHLFVAILKSPVDDVHA